MQAEFYKIFNKSIEQNASDVHLIADQFPAIRTQFGFKQICDIKIEPEDIAEFLKTIAKEKQVQKLQETGSVDIGFDLKIDEINYRFRTHFYKTMQNIAVAIRIFPNKIKTLDQICAPQILKDACSKSSGLILITGATGSGKSTTLAAMLEEINVSYSKHIVTIEDPVEYIYERKNSIFSQRNIGSDCVDYASALKEALRQDPDVIMIGEIRDAHTLLTALMASETGHLVLASMHAGSVVGALQKVIAMAGDKAEQARIALANNLIAVTYQVLLKDCQNQRIAIYETLAENTASMNLIRENKTHQLYSSMQLNQKYGSCTLSQAIATAIKSNKINKEEINNFKNLNEIENLLIGGI